jgi:FkbM family methyltransferase
MDTFAAPTNPGQDLMEDVAFILQGAPSLVVDVGCHHGHTTLGYLNRFPGCSAYAFEAEADNFAQARDLLAPFADRVKLFPSAISDCTGEITFNVNSHNGTHSTLDIGEQRYWASFVEQVETRRVPSMRLDDVFKDTPEAVIDLLHMDIQGGELSALHGAETLLAERRIKLIYCEVEIYPLYSGQPLLWDIGAFLHRKGYRFYSLYDRYYHQNNPRVLSWSDALFICEDLVQLPEHAA